MLSRLLITFAALVLASCKPAVDPNKGHFSCETNPDCGALYDCKPQADGGGLCFKSGTCVAETCNGSDDDCNGVSDDLVPDRSMICNSGLPGVCATGNLRCTDAGASCVLAGPCVVGALQRSRR